jgi:hypothetical protein
MAAIDVLLSAIDERTVAQQVSIKHDQTRASYRNYPVTTGTYIEFERIITDYYMHHHSRCVTRGGRLDYSQASSFAKNEIEKEYRKRNGNVSSAFDDACYGTNGGMRRILDIIADGMKAEAIENYIRSVFDRVVKPVDWHEKVEIIRQFINCCGSNLHDSVDPRTPERYSQNYTELIRAYVDSLRNVSSIFRRL